MDNSNVNHFYAVWFPTPKDYESYQQNNKHRFFDHFPFDILAIIFDHCDLIWRPRYEDYGAMLDPGTPLICIALRQQPIAYTQAMEMFYKISRVTFH